MALRAVSEPRLEPHNLEAEYGVLGSCLVDPDAISKVAAHLDAGDFYRHSHTLIWRAMTTLYYRRVPIDFITLTGELRRAGDLEAIGHESYLAELVSSTISSVHARDYADIVREASMRRRLIHAAQDVVTAAWDEARPLSDAVGVADAAVSDVTRATTRGGYRSFREIMDDLWHTIDSKQALVMATGIVPLDARIGGVSAGDLVTIAARPGMGKTAIATQIAIEQGQRGNPVGYISLEMDDTQIGSRGVGISGGVSMYAVRLGRELSDMQRDTITHTIGRLAELPIFIDDGSDGSLHDVIARARALIAERQIRFLVIDHVHLMYVSKRSGRIVGNRTQEIGVMSQTLKTLARETGVVVLCLAQLSRAMEHRNPPFPLLSDLRDSGTLEQDSDIVIFVHRPDQYPDSDPNMDGLAQLVIAKHRNGPTGLETMRFIENLTAFKTLEDGYGTA